jgi:hypothetical protein
MAIKIQNNTVIYDDRVFQVGAGTTLQRPASPQIGMIRFNTDLNAFEGYDPVTLTWAPIAGAAGNNGPEVTFSLLTFGGELVTGQGVSRWYFDSARTITGIFVSTSIAPTGSSIIFDVNKNGTTIFTTQANRPTIATSQFTATATPAVTSIAAGDYLTVDVDQVGSTIAGGDSAVRIRLA